MKFASPIVLAVAVAIGCDKPAVEPPATKPTTAPATMPATTQAAKPLELHSLLDVVRANDARFPTTRPLSDPVELPAAARLKLTEPTYLDSRGDLWLTREGAPPTPEVLKRAPKDQTHVTRERVRFVYWRPVTEPWSPELIAHEGDTDVWITPTVRLPLDKRLDRDWSRAGSWNAGKMNAAVVPTSTGVSIIRVRENKIDEQHIELVSPSPGSSTQFALDIRGLLAWSIDPSGTSKVARYLDGKWTMLTPDANWPDRVEHVVPFLDGTVLAIGSDGETLRLRSVMLESIAIDEARVTELVKLLANRSAKTREQAQSDLAQFGVGAWPLLRKLSPTQPPEARIRIKALLGDETTPTLNGITPEPGPAKIVCRLNDGGVVMRFENGGSAVNANNVVQSFKPAWLAVRPGEPAKRLPESLDEELRTSTNKLRAWGDEWVVEHDVDGPKRWMGNHTEALLKKSEAATFKRFVGIDAMSRWVFKTADADGQTLVLDPTLPDPTPRLPVWTIDVNNNTVGWNDDNWPVMRRGGAWVLKDGAWQAMKGDVDAQFHTSLPKPALTTMPATTQAVTQAVTPLLVDSDGNQYFDGLQSLTVETKDGRRLSWLLPPEAVGDGAINREAVLLEADGKLFLCNAGGKLARLTRQFDQAEPFKLDAVFTRNIPGDDLRRFWKDPAGRLVLASGGNKLSIAFPSGRISGNMSNMIPAAALRQAFEEEEVP
jgi:hypothetical protein